MTPTMLLAIAAVVVFLVVARQKKQKQADSSSLLADIVSPAAPVIKKTSDVLKTKLRELAGELERVQFDPVASLLEAVADEDEVTALAMCKRIRAAVRNPSSLLDMFKPTTDYLLKTMLEDNETREKIVKLLKTTAAK